MAEVMEKGQVAGVTDMERRKTRRATSPAEMFFGILLLLTTLLAAYGVLSFVVKLLAAAG